MFTLPQWIARLTKGYIKATGKEPDGLAKLKIKMEAAQRVRDQSKVVKGNFNPNEKWWEARKATPFSSPQTPQEKINWLVKNVDPSAKQTIPPRETLEAMLKDGREDLIDHFFEMHTKELGKPKINIDTSGLKHPELVKKMMTDEKLKPTLVKTPKKTPPEDLASGGIARVGYVAGKIVKGGAWIIKNLKKSVKEVDQGTGPYSKLNSMQQGLLKKELNTLIKQLEQGGTIPNEMLDTMIADPKFKSVVQTRSTDKDLYELESVLLDRQAGKQAEQIVDDVFGKGHPENQQIDMLEKFDVTGKTKHASGGIAGQLHLYDGGRARFDKGKKVDLSKRAFLKGTGATLGVLSMLPFVGKFFKPAAKAVGKFKGTPNLVVDITKTPNMPEWYIPLIKKVLNKGDEVTDKAATAARERVHRDILPDGDEVTVTQNIDNQTISVNVADPKAHYLSKTGAGETPYQIQYSKGKVIEEGKYKGQKEPDTLEVDEPYTAQVGPDTKDVEIEFDISTYNPKAEVHDTSVLESYATGKKVKSRGSGEVYDPYEGYSPDLKADKAEGGRVSLSKGGLAHVLGV